MIKKVPFTLSLTLTILILSLVTGSFYKPLTLDFVKSVSFDAQSVSFVNFYSIFTMIFFAKDPLMVFGLAIISIGSFIYEYKFGTKKTLILFFASHFTGIFCILLLYFVRVQLSGYSDIGASIGLWGVAGAVLGYMKYKNFVFLTLVTFLIVYLLLRPGEPASIEHPAAFFSGMIYQKVMENYEKFKK